MRYYILTSILITLSVCCGSVCFAQGKVQREKKELRTQQRQTQLQSKKEEAIVKVSDPDGFINDVGFVELGLPSGTLWATCNVGASSPTDNGDYFAWGETKTKYSYHEGNSVTNNKSFSQLQSDGIIDANSLLTPSFDAAREKLGSTWRLPSRSEVKELLEKCIWRWAKINNRNGYVVTGPNGKNIFLPASGSKYETNIYNDNERGGLWISYIDKANDGDNFSTSLSFSKGTNDFATSARTNGYPIRPVSDISKEDALKFGMYYYEDENYEVASSLLKKAGDIESGKALYYLGRSLLYIASKRPDYHGTPDEVISLWRKAGNLGYATAQFDVGMDYMVDYRRKDLTKAAEWVKKAADNGYSMAQYYMGTFYAEGKGVPESFENAIMYFKKNIQDHPNLCDSSAYQLGLFYYNGYGVDVDKNEAYKYFKIASEQGHRDAKKFLESNFK